MQSAVSSRNVQRRENWVLLGVVLLAIGAATLVATLTLLHLRNAAQERVRINAENLGTSVTQTIDGLFSSIDIALLASADEISRELAGDRVDAQALSRYLERQGHRIPHVAFLRATDRHGDVVYGAKPDGRAVNLADREFFQVLAANPGYGMYIAAPVQSKITGRYVLTLAHRVEARDGVFAGTVYASIDVQELEAMLGRIAMEPGGSLGLRDRKLRLIARRTFGVDNPIPVGSSLVSLPFQQALQRQPERGEYTSDPSSLDPMVRHYYYQRSAKYGYLVNVGLPMQFTLQDWRKQAWTTFGLLLLFAVTLLGLVLQIGRSRARLHGLVLSLEQSRKELEENNLRLGSAEEKQRGLLEKLHTAVIVHGADTQITFCNARASQLLGLTEAQIYGKSAIDPAWCFINMAGHLLAPDDYPVAKVAATLSPIVEMMVGVKVPHKEELTWLMVSAFPEFDHLNQLHQIVVNFYDITHMREADERWRFALEGSGDGVWDLNLQTRSVVYSKRYAEMLGYAEGELEGSVAAWNALVHPDDLPRMQAGMAQYLLDPSSIFTEEYRQRCKDGSYMWVYTRGMVVSRGADGAPLRMVGMQTNIDYLKAAEAKVWNEANFDALTQLPNRRLFYDRLEMKLKQAQRERSLLALLFIDLDHFKEVNDTLGHHVGDELLVEAARRIQQTVRQCDTVARLGGDEFTVILTDAQTPASIAEVAQKILQALAQPFALRHSESYMSASVGIALYPADGLTVNDMVKNADQAMYAAKRAGRNRLQFFTLTMYDAALARMALVNDLRRALGAGQFELYYQPIVDLRRASIIKAEALLRWHHPQRGAVSPVEFIPVAEETGVIHAIGDWVLQQATAQVGRWQQRYGADFQISVNRSPVEFSSDQYGTTNLVKQLQTLGIAGSSVVIEITEGVLMEADERVDSALMQYRDAGIQVAIDDFGTGYSSLSYLKKFDIDYLKIDRSFVRNLAPDSADLALCEAIVMMAHKLGIQVIAEGIETVQQRDLLREIGCDFGQGYLFSRPVPAQEFETVVASWMQDHAGGGAQAQDAQGVVSAL